MLIFGTPAIEFLKSVFAVYGDDDFGIVFSRREYSNILGHIAQVDMIISAPKYCTPNRFREAFKMARQELNLDVLFTFTTAKQSDEIVTELGFIPFVSDDSNGYICDLRQSRF